MKLATRLAISAICLLTISSAVKAQASDVTFRVPLNLTQISPDIRRIEIRCRVASAAIDGGSSNRTVEFPVAGGRLVTVASIVIPIARLNDPMSHTATFECSLHGFDEPERVWRTFNSNTSRPAFRLSPTPAALTGSFPWVQVDANAPPPPASTTSPPGGN